MDGDTYDFTHPEIFSSLGTGYRLIVKFDPAEPQIGAAIYNNESSTVNFNRWQVGEFICWADHLPTVPRYDWTEGSYDDPAAMLKRRFNKAVRTAYGAVGLNHRTSTALDGRGAKTELTMSGKAEIGRVESRNSSHVADTETQTHRNTETPPRRLAMIPQLCPLSDDDPLLRQY